ncbi:MAG: ATP-binding protein [Gammaproteobacteria bacterium]
MSNLYSDFRLTKDNCHREPIHRPEAIQGTGQLFAFARNDRSRLLAMSEPDSQTLGIAPDELWAIGGKALPIDLQAIIDRQEDKALPASVTPYQLPNSQESTLAICHQHEDVIFLELETAEALDIHAFQEIAFADAAKKINSLDELCDFGCRQMQQTFGFDRVMVYQFDHDGHGFVAGEAKRDHLEPFLGLHYPATDIPQPSRDLFLTTRSRTIPNVNLPNHQLLFRNAEDDKQAYLDLSYCQLRATSPIHIEYLRNMGVDATMTLAIIVRGKLWGLFAMHHYSARNLDYTARLRAELFALVFSTRVLEIDTESQEKTEQRSRKKENQFLDELRVGDKYQLRILRDKAQLQGLCPCDGAAVISSSMPYYSAGIAPGQNSLGKLREWLIRNDVESAYATDNIEDASLRDIEGVADLGGFLAICISEVTETYIVWFRLRQSQQIAWAGDPRKPQVQTYADEQGKQHLSPRRSFEKWLENVDTRCVPWERWTMQMANRLREKILRLELKYTAVMTARGKREFMELTYTASHDLQEPLRSQLNYLDLLNEELGDHDNADLKMYVEATTRAVIRMQALIQDMLEYSQLSSENTWVMVDINALLDDIKSDVASSLEHSGGTLTWGPMPAMVSDPRLLRAILQNLITNGLKFAEPGRQPSVHISLEEKSQTFDILVKDNGIGIEEKYHDRIFSMFTRLHRRDEYSGTGIGLAIVKRAVEALGGSIGVISSIKNGSTFWCRFHKAKLHKGPSNDPN